MLERFLLRSAWTIIVALMVAAQRLQLSIHAQTQNAPLQQ